MSLDPLQSAKPKFWGPALWQFLHSMAANYPESPNAQYKASCRQFFYSLRYLLPCSLCRQHYSTFLAKKPPQVDNTNSIKEWVLWLHNEVNAQLGKKETWTMETVDKTYMKNQNSSEDHFVNDHEARGGASRAVGSTTNKSEENLTNNNSKFIINELSDYILQSSKSDVAKINNPIDLLEKTFQKRPMTENLPHVSHTNHTNTHNSHDHVDVRITSSHVDVGNTSEHACNTHNNNTHHNTHHHSDHTDHSDHLDHLDRSNISLNNFQSRHQIRINKGFKALPPPLNPNKFSIQTLPGAMSGGPNTSGRRATLPKNARLFPLSLEVPVNKPHTHIHRSKITQNRSTLPGKTKKSGCGVKSSNAPNNKPKKSCGCGK
jgi:hypothetical protein